MRFWIITSALLSRVTRTEFDKMSTSIFEVYQNLQASEIALDRSINEIKIMVLKVFNNTCFLF